MDIKILAANEKVRQYQLYSSIVIATLMLISNLILSIILLTSDKQIILTPPHVNNNIEISKHNVSESYLSEMSVYFLSKLLDLNIHNIHYQSDIVLRHTSLKYYQTMREFFELEKKKYTEYNISTYFVPTQLEMNIEKLAVIATGTLITQFAKAGKEEVQVKYLLGFDYKGGILGINNFSILEDKEDKDE